jgi:glutamate 5-kinase
MDWHREKTERLAKAKRILVKVGSAVIATADGVDNQRIEHLAAQIAALHDRGLEIVLVSSGAVATGRGVLKKSREIAGLPHKQAAAAIGQSRLMHHYDLSFAARGKISAQVLLTREDLRSRSRFLNVRNTFAALLAWRAIPVVNENDTVAVQDLKFGDNDNLSGLLLNLTEADLFVNLTSAPGVYGASPDADPEAAVMPCIEDIDRLDLEKLCGGKTSLGSGGMYSKLLSARRAAQIGVPTCIAPGNEPDILLRLFDGEDAGTWVRAGGKAVSSRKFWLAYNEDIAGGVTVDAGAAKALLSGGKSLLPAGITAVDGNFGKGSLVRILGPDGTPLGVGLSNYAGNELRRIMGKKLAHLSSAENIYHEAVHRDNMLLHAAV